jgi:hypothetical protein
MVMSARASASEAPAADDSHHELEVRHKDLLVVGPGVLGSLIAQQWFQVCFISASPGKSRQTSSDLKVFLWWHITVKHNRLEKRPILCGL